MKHYLFTTFAALLLLLPIAAQAEIQSSPNYTINAGRIVSGGTASTDVSGMSKSGIAIGQGVFIPASKVSSPGYGAGTVALAAISTPSLVVSTLPDNATTATGIRMAASIRARQGWCQVKVFSSITL